MKNVVGLISTQPLLPRAWWIFFLYLYRPISFPRGGDRERKNIVPSFLLLFFYFDFRLPSTLFLTRLSIYPLFSPYFILNSTSFLFFLSQLYFFFLCLQFLQLLFPSFLFSPSSSAPISRFGCWINFHNTLFIYLFHSSSAEAFFS